jgi:hypothetical protein
MKISNRQHLLAFVAIGAIALFAADRLVVSPLTASWKKRADRIGELRKQVNDGRRLLDNEASYRSRWAQMQTNTLSSNAPQAEEQVLKAFDRWSSDSRVSVLSINPLWRREAEDHATLECRVDASGSLSAVSRFLYDLERDPMAVKIQALELSSKDNDGQQLSLGLQVSGLSLTATERKP